jgi:uncharacterized protein (DUF1501 family)
VTQQALDVSDSLHVSDPTFSTAFPNTTLANQLRQVAKLMKVNQDLGYSFGNQQIFFCQVGGFDTHQNQRTNQGNLLRDFSNAMRAFYDCTVELGLGPNVTTFTLSDFGRTLNPGGSGANSGSDHGWGSHHFVMGDSVVGGNFYGRPMPSSDGGNGTVFPTLRMGSQSPAGPYDADTRGRWIPTVAVEQYAATLASWYGLAPADIPIVFPFLGGSPPRFSPANLGFMG